MPDLKIEAASNRKEIAFDFSGWEFGCGIFDPMIGKACGEVMLSRMKHDPPTLHIFMDIDRPIDISLFLPFANDAALWTMPLEDLILDAAGSAMPQEREKLQQHLRDLATAIDALPQRGD